MTIDQIKQAQKNGETTVTIVRSALERARSKDEYNAFIHLTEKRALARAQEIDEKIKEGQNVGELSGIPFVVKDNFLAFDGATTAASEYLKEYHAPLQATAVERLEAEGAICIGKVNLDAFAHGGSTENSAFGVTHNAIDSERVAGGSSGGSAVAVALDVVPFALGTDTGGSIRQPASFNGVVGIKPTYGRVSRFGVIAMASGTDTVGVLSDSVEDTDTVLRIMSGSDHNDMTTLKSEYVSSQPPKGKRLGIIKECISENNDPAVNRQFEIACKQLQESGYVIEEVNVPMIKHALAIYYIVVTAEISSNLARYDGVRYGHRAKEAKTLDEMYTLSRAQGFVPENKRRIMIGSYVLSSGYFDAYYQQAQKARTLLINEFNALFEQYDALLAPVSPTPAFKIGEKKDPITMYLADTMTVPASLAGLPAVSVPAGTTDKNLPVGIQIIGPMEADSEVLAIAKDVEKGGL